jgi:hypothetical protein
MRLVLFTMFSSLFFASSAIAFDPTTSCPKLPDDPIKAQIMAGELFAKAENEYQQSHPITALEGFLCSHHIIQHENTLFNIAQIAKVSNLKQQALDILKDYVQNAKGRNKVEPINDIIAELSSDRDRTESNGVPDTPTENEERTLVANETDDAPAPEANRSTGKSKGLKLAAFSLMGAGGAALICGAVFQGLAAGAQNRAEETDSYSVFQNEEDKMAGFQIGAIVGLVAGGILLGSGAAIFVVTKRREHNETAVSPTLSLSLTQLAIGGRF